jgi:hypothetical protein
MLARVKPQPGHGTPVNLKNGHSQNGRLSAAKPMWRHKTPVNIKLSLRSRNIVAIGENTVCDNIAGGIL